MARISTCQICEKVFKVGPGSKGVACSRACTAKISSIRETARQQALREQRIAEHGRPCLNPACNNIVIIKDQTFCSNSCSATVRNKERIYKSKPKNNCLVCGKIAPRPGQKFCSRCCSSDSRIIRDDEYNRKRMAYRQSVYRAKGYRQLAAGADKEKIKEIYLNCPAGYEVDHIVPLSLGGLHHEDNLQYLTIEENRRKGNRWIG